jgi:inorganic phosphate transporter, PiT family
MKIFVQNPSLYRAPEGDTPPPPWIRGLLVLTCTGVSFAHGSNDGQKGMGLIMLILIGTVPTAYALNLADPRDDVKDYVRTRQLTPNTITALEILVNEIGTETANFKELAKIPENQVRNFRNDMYLVSESLRLLTRKPP